ncbi:hypothetical protein [Flavobacterium lacus]|uniref:Parallel beta helix pectate lyase-like protein n=1 Tax=Flavobacterium lacus TaxID=1353778 RepID=A0A328WRM4_9FLAO|nr:hypothetical protein [Flavobacterium lacus]RAR48990.1 hypothetical protein B0I10_104127 [Flavobacterium lacus]
MRNLLFLFFIISAISLTSCRNDFEFKPSSGGLEFSRDTVYFDTVFSNIGSSTYTLKVYNRSDEDISIPSIRLGKGLDSKYRMTVDGMVGNNRIFENVEMLAKDSMYIFIEVTADVAAANPTDFLYTDQILFGQGTSEQKVELITLIQDAYFLYPQRFDDGLYENITIGGSPQRGFILDENDPINGNEYIWNNSKPYVIYGYAAVPANKTLVIEAGARIHFHAESVLIIGDQGSVKVNGEISNNPDNPLERHVIFQGDRLEPLYEDVPGQWGAIWLTQGSKNNEFTNCIIKNGVVGLLIDGNTGLTNPEADVRLKNVQIYDHSNFGILARTAYIKGENVVINSAGQFALACTYGGKYNFNHSTFNNNWASSRQLSVYLNNFFDEAEPEILPIEEATFTNCIIYGSNQIQMLVDKRGEGILNYKFDHCLIKFNNVNNIYTNNLLYQFTDTTRYVNCIIATNNSAANPKFLNVIKNKLIIGDDSAAKGQANASFSTLPDILDQPRNPPLDMGAYNHTIFVED